MLEKGRALTLTDRKELKVMGVKEVLSFDENGAELDTADGRLCVMGEDIRVRELNSESNEVFITGRVCELSYKEELADKKRGFLGRLFG